MNHCEDCGKRVDTGRSDDSAAHIRCAACEAAYALRDWFYPASPRNVAVWRMRQRIKELEHDTQIPCEPKS